jgi:phospholipase C
MIRLKSILAVFCGICLAAALSSCGGIAGNSSSSPAWNLTMAAVGNFSPGGTGQYSITATNGGSSATSGTVSVSDSLPNVFTATSATGTGWTCTLSPVSCTRSDSLAAGASYPTIALIVKVAQNASGTVTNQATVSGGGASSGSASVQTSIGSGNGGKIQHVVIIFQENRTPDNLFHDSVLINRGADIASSGKNSIGKTITLTPVSLVTNYDLGHGHTAFLGACDWNGSECLMDAADQTGCSPSNNCPPNAQFQYVQASDVQPYFAMAETYAFGDRMFQTNQGASFPAHQYILSGASAVCVPGASCPSGTTSTYYVSGNPGNDQRADGSAGAGCLNPPGAQVNVLDTSQPFPNGNEISFTDPECFEHPTLTDVMDASGVSWRYYAAADGSIWTAPDAIQHMCVPAGPADQRVCSGSDWTGQNPKVVLEGVRAQIVTDIQNCDLPAVTWVIPDGPNSDHAGGNQGTGPSWVASIVNQIGTNAACPGTGEVYWNNTAIVVTWDDWGGWYDHVTPPLRNSGLYPNSYEYGFRVPLIVISPYAKPAYISHQYNDFGSILKFIEETFSLPEVNPSVGYADSYALGDLSDFFNFNQTPLPFTQIPADYDKQYFVNRKGTPTPPDND